MAGLSGVMGVLSSWNALAMGVEYAGLVYKPGAFRATVNGALTSGCPLADSVRVYVPSGRSAGSWAVTYVGDTNSNGRYCCPTVTTTPPRACINGFVWPLNVSRGRLAPESAMMQPGATTRSVL